MDFYTYQYQRPDGTIYYVGKGKNNRAFTKNSKYVPVPSRACILIQHWESEEKAFEMEKWWISFWGRKDNGTGILRNLTDGGEGSSGYILSDEQKKKSSEGAKKLWSDRAKGILPPAIWTDSPAWNKGMTMDDEYRKRSSEGQKKRFLNNPESFRNRTMPDGWKENISRTLKEKGIAPSPEARKKASEVRLPSIKCIECGNEFSPKRRTQTCCSPACRRKHNNDFWNVKRKSATHA